MVDPARRDWSATLGRTPGRRKRPPSRAASAPRAPIGTGSAGPYQVGRVAARPARRRRRLVAAAALRCSNLITGTSATRASGPRAAGRGRPGSRRSRRSGSGWSNELDHRRRDLVDRASLCVRGFRSYGRRFSGRHSSIRSASATSPRPCGASVNCAPPGATGAPSLTTCRHAAEPRHARPDALTCGRAHDPVPLCWREQVLRGPAKMLDGDDRRCTDAVLNS
jgi:hypothetical protein